jgi:hypothetical protein
VYTDANIIMGAESADFSFTDRIQRSLRMTEFGTYQGALTISCKTLD